MALVEADVVGPCPIVDALGRGDIEAGATVVLDTEHTNVDALVGVHVKNVRPYVKPARGKADAGASKPAEGG